MTQSRTSSLGDNISATVSVGTHKCSPINAVELADVCGSSSSLEDEDMEVPEIIEEIIEMLLTGLKDTVCQKGEILISMIGVFRSDFEMDNISFCQV